MGQLHRAKESAYDSVYRARMQGWLLPEAVKRTVSRLKFATTSGEFLQ
jgi:hypothetical protein